MGVGSELHYQASARFVKWRARGWGDNWIHLRYHRTSIYATKVGQ